MRPDLLIHRWVSPREGVLAEISGPASADGVRRLAVASVDLVESVLTGAATMKLYSDQLYRGNFNDIGYGWDRGPGATVASMVPDAGVNNMCDLVNLATWNFSAINSGKQTATTEVRARSPSPATRRAAATPGTRSVAASRRRSSSGTIATSPARSARTTRSSRRRSG